MADESAVPVAALPQVRLRAVAAWLDEHPDIDPFDVVVERHGARVGLYGLNADDMARTARDIGGRWEKGANDNLFWLSQTVAPDVRVELVGSRERVCTRVVTGTKIVEVPDPAAPMVSREVEIVEWQCEPLLAGAAEASSGDGGS